mmetsp:Transcript_39313/g.81607  ORF Transcript_39313/g.81607 Transcript_39313/m.81607 type:complete len:204 (-) Transcript_39313:2354-2965(-)
MGSTQLQFPNGHTIATIQFASYSATMRRTIMGPTAGHLFTTAMSTFLAPTVLDTKACGGLRGFATARNGTTATPAMGGTQIGSSHSRFGTSAGKLTSLATPVRGTKELVPRALVTSGMGTTTTPAVRNAKARRTLRTFGTSIVFALTIAGMFQTIRTFGNGGIVTALNATHLGGSPRSGEGCRRVKIHQAITPFWGKHGTIGG